MNKESGDLRILKVKWNTTKVSETLFSRIFPTVKGDHGLRNVQKWWQRRSHPEFRLGHVRKGDGDVAWGDVQGAISPETKEGPKPRRAQLWPGCYCFPGRPVRWPGPRAGCTGAESGVMDTNLAGPRSRLPDLRDRSHVRGTSWALGLHPVSERNRIQPEPPVRSVLAKLPPRPSLCPHRNLLDSSRQGLAWRTHGALEFPTLQTASVFSKHPSRTDGCTSS